jgi:allene oxide cyclase
MNVKHSSISEFALSRGCQLALAIGLVGALGVFGGANFAFAGETLHVVERQLTDTTIHLGAKGTTDSMGDMIVFANPIFDSTNTHQLGILQGNCVRVIVGKSWECFFTFVLANDRITLEGPYADSGESVFAITGGTGRYVGAKGQLSARARESKPGAPASEDLIFEIR